MLEAVSETKIQLPESEIPTRWYNIASDMPNRPQPVLHPGTGEPVGPGRPRAALPDGADPPGGEHRCRGRDPGRGARHLQALAADAALSRRATGARDRHEVTDLLQVRGRQSGWEPQAEHRGRAGLLQQGGGPHAPLDRDRRRPVGQRARLCVQARRARVQGLHGQGLVRAEAVSALADARLGLGGRGQPVRGDRSRPQGARGAPGLPRAASGSPSPKPWRTPRVATTPRTRWAASSTTSCCTRR